MVRYPQTEDVYEARNLSFTLPASSLQQQIEIMEESLRSI